MQSSRLRDVAITLLAPIAWGTTYVVTKELLPPHRPLFSAVVRALPVGLVIVASRRRLPSGHWWWRAAVLGTVNIGLFFALLFVGAYRLPGGLASTLQSTSPLAVIVFAALLLGESPRPGGIAGSVLGVVGVGLLVLRGSVAVDALGVVAALGSVAVSALGFVLVKRWAPEVELLTLTGWQLVAGGLILLPLALAVEGAPPRLDVPAVAGYFWLATAGTGLAYVVWFRGVRRMSAASVSLLGLVNPVVATLLGVAISGEEWTAASLAGMSLIFAGILLGQLTARPRTAVATRDYATSKR